MTFTLHAPQIIWLLFILAEFSLAVIKHGKPKDNPNYNAVTTIFTWLLINALLYWGGFFRP